MKKENNIATKQPLTIEFPFNHAVNGSHIAATLHRARALNHTDIISQNSSRNNWEHNI